MCGAQMSKQAKPVCRENTASIRARQKLDSLSLDVVVQAEINKHLYDIAFQNLAFIADKMRTAYANAEGLCLIPTSLGLKEPIKAKAAVYLIRQNVAIGKQLHDLYSLDEYVQGVSDDL